MNSMKSNNSRLRATSFALGSLVFLMASCKMATVKGNLFDDDFEEPNGASSYSTPTVVSPQENQVFQRLFVNSGLIRIELSDIDVNKIAFARVQISGTDFQGKTIAHRYNAELKRETNQKISGTANLPSGFYSLVEILTYNKEKKIVSQNRVKNVGVGEVFIAAGGVNGTSCSHGKVDLGEKPISVLTSSGWAKSTNNIAGAQDSSLCPSGASQWNAVAANLNQKFKVPIGISLVGDRDSLIGNWKESAEAKKPHKLNLRAELIERMKKLQLMGGFRATLWHHGEKDAQEATTVDSTTYSRTYRAGLIDLVKNSNSEINKPTQPWFIAKASYCERNHFPNENGWGNTTAQQAIIRAQETTIETNNNFIRPGPNTDKIRARGPQGNNKDCHFSQKGLLEAATLWSKNLEPFIDQVAKIDRNPPKGVASNISKVDGDEAMPTSRVEREIAITTVPSPTDDKGVLFVIGARTLPIEEIFLCKGENYLQCGRNGSSEKIRIKKVPNTNIESYSLQKPYPFDTSSKIEKFVVTVWRNGASVPNQHRVFSIKSVENPIQ